MKTVIKSHVAWYIQHYIYTHLNPNSLKKKKKDSVLLISPFWVEQNTYSLLKHSYCYFTSEATVHPANITYLELPAGDFCILNTLDIIICCSRK